MPLLALVGLIVVLSLFSFLAFWVLVPLALVAMAMMAFGAVDWRLWRPDRLWNFMRDRSARRNAALQNATVRLLRQKGVAAEASDVESRGFGLTCQAAGERVWEAATEALYRLRRGEAELASGIGGPSMALSLTTLALAVILMVLLAAAGHLTVLTAVMAVLAARLLAPALSPWIEGKVVVDVDLRSLQLQALEERSEQRLTFGGRFVVARAGFFIVTIDGGYTVEAEIVE